MIEVLLADDQPLARAGLRALIDTEPDMTVVGEAADGASAIRQARALRPDVVLMDVRMPGMDGVAATRVLVGEGLAQVLVLTTFDLDEYVYGALRAGAAGFLLKSVEAPRLVEAVRLVAAGEGVLAPQVTRRLIDAFARTAPPKPAPDLSRLTEREREVLRCIGMGMSNAQIAARLFISETTVKTHVSKVLAKLELRSRVQAAILAQESGLLDG